MTIPSNVLSYIFRSSPLALLMPQPHQGNGPSYKSPTRSLHSPSLLQCRRICIEPRQPLNPEMQCCMKRLRLKLQRRRRTKDKSIAQNRKRIQRGLAKTADLVYHQPLKLNMQRINHETFNIRVIQSWRMQYLHKRFGP